MEPLDRKEHRQEIGDLRAAEREKEMPGKETDR